jgi:hypothetical protein
MNATDPSPAKRPPRWRRLGAAVLIVIGVVMFPIAGLAVWLHNTVLDTDQYVATIGPLASDPDVQQAAANRVTNALVEQTDLQERVTGVLPERASFVAPFIADGARDVVYDASLRLVQSDQFETIWKNVNRRAHSRLVALLQGKGTDTLETKNGQLVVNVDEIVENVKQRLDDRGITVFDNVRVPANRATIVLLESGQVRKAQDAVDLLDKLVVALPVLSLVCLAGGVALSTDRRRSVLRAALGIAFAMVLLLTAVNIGRSFYLDALPSSVNRAAAESVYDQLVSFLRLGLRMLFTLALVVAIAAWLAGPTRLATSIREGVRNVVNRPTTAGVQPSRLGTFVGDARVVLRVLVVGIGLVILVVLDHPGPIAVLLIAALVLLGLLLIEFLARGTGRVATPSSGTVAAE